MRVAILIAVASLPLATLPAFAQQGTSTSANGSSSSATQSRNGAVGAQAQQKMRQQLEKDGYKDVRITPEAFVVHAKDPQGDPVVMMITPDQVTSIVEESGSSTAPAGSASSASKNKAGSGK